MTDHTIVLDTEELLHIAVASVGRGDFEGALTTIKRILAEEPEHAVANHMLGAAYAQLGMRERAVEPFVKALAADPQLHMARLQLGLLKLALGNADEAQADWAPLDAIDHGDPIYLFKEGMVHLIGNRLDEAANSLMLGVERNRTNPQLTEDMLGVLAKIEAFREAEAQRVATGGDGGQHVMKSAYGAGESA